MRLPATSTTENGPVPDVVVKRSGKLRLRYAPRRYIHYYACIARVVLAELYQLNYDGCIVTDQSSLLDYESNFDVTMADAILTIEDLYAVDVSDVRDGNILNIFRRIRAKQRGDKEYRRS
jgi:hypothetical protein